MESVVSMQSYCMNINLNNYQNILHLIAKIMSNYSSLCNNVCNQLEMVQESLETQDYIYTKKHNGWVSKTREIT